MKSAHWPETLFVTRVHAYLGNDVLAGTVLKDTKLCWMILLDGTAAWVLQAGTVPSAMPVRWVGMPLVAEDEKPGSQTQAEVDSLIRPNRHLL
jgi:hypothetical protein